MTTITRKYEEVPAASVAMLLSEGGSLNYGAPDNGVTVVLLGETSWLRAYGGTRLLNPTKVNLSGVLVVR